MKRILIVALSLLATACAAPSANAPGAVPAPAAGLNPVGTFDFTTNDGEEEIKGTIEITGAPGAYAGRVRTPHDDIPLAQVAVAGQVMSLMVNTPEGPLTFTLTFTGNDFTGTWAMAGATGPITGQRAP